MATKNPLHVTVTGAAGQIGYSLLFRVASGQLLGPDQQTLAAWNFTSAWPVRWVTGPLDSMKNEVLTEVLEFAYATVTRAPQADARSMVGSVSSLIG